MTGGRNDNKSFYMALQEVNNNLLVGGEGMVLMVEENKILIWWWLGEVLTLGNLRRVDEFSPPNYAFSSLVWVYKAKPLLFYLTVASSSFSKASA